MSRGCICAFVKESAKMAAKKQSTNIVMQITKEPLLPKFKYDMTPKIYWLYIL